MLSKEDRRIIQQIGRYRYKKMKNLGLTYEQYVEQEEKKQKEKEFKKKIGYKKYAELQELGMTLEEYEKFVKETKYKNRQKHEEKNKIRYRTIRYVERYCDLEMKCQICGEKAEIHHPNYNDYLKINLLCKKHHTALHNFELVPPEIINLETIVSKNQVQKEKTEFIKGQIENMKLDVLKNNYTYKDLAGKYGISASTIRIYFLKDVNYTILKEKIEDNRKRKNILKSNCHVDNPFIVYKKKYNLTSREISEITKVPLPTIRAIEIGKTKIENLKENTKKKLAILNLQY